MKCLIHIKWLPDQNKDAQECKFSTKLAVQELKRNPDNEQHFGGVQITSVAV